jgi:hypothetical protein
LQIWQNQRGLYRPWKNSIQKNLLVCAGRQFPLQASQCLVILASESADITVCRSTCGIHAIIVQGYVMLYPCNLIPNDRAWASESTAPGRGAHVALELLLEDAASCRGYFPIT